MSKTKAYVPRSLIQALYGLYLSHKNGLLTWVRKDKQNIQTNIQTYLYIQQVDVVLPLKTRRHAVI